MPYRVRLPDLDAHRLKETRNPYQTSVCLKTTEKISQQSAEAPEQEQSTLAETSFVESVDRRHLPESIDNQPSASYDSQSSESIDTKPSALFDTLRISEQLETEKSKSGGRTRNRKTKKKRNADSLSVVPLQCQEASLVYRVRCKGGSESFIKARVLCDPELRDKGEASARELHRRVRCLAMDGDFPTSGQSASQEEAVEEMKDCRSITQHWCRSTVMPERGPSIFQDLLKPRSHTKLPKCVSSGFLCWRRGSEAYNGSSSAISMGDFSCDQGDSEDVSNDDPLVDAHRRLIGEVFFLRSQVQNIMARRDLLIQSAGEGVGQMGAHEGIAGDPVWGGSTSSQGVSHGSLPQDLLWGRDFRRTLLSE
ncbi:hypothetical protein F2Q70_00036159 [Brassica cretica]|uniref:Uncharacterized protein n=1 Tax=Brassica cretica TaxID=69181 RepID=A0A8S9JSM7_BRACR|nr:hypothetical protein F2Q70_00036159 [Brassica cretica]